MLTRWILAVSFLGMGLSGPAASNLFGQGYETLILKNGMQIGPGQTMNIATLNFGGNNPDMQKGEITSRDIVKVDDGLRMTFFHQRQLAAAGIPARERPLKIEHSNIRERYVKGSTLQAITGIRGLTQFDDFGRRRVNVENRLKKTGSNLFIQGITEVTPLYVRIDVLQAGDPVVWDTRVALSSIPSEQIKTILLHNARSGNAQDFLDIASLFDLAKRYPDAISVIEQTMRIMPELEAELRPKLDTYRQSFADQMFEEVELRRKAGQYQLASSLLKGFDRSQLAIETQLKIDARLKEDESDAKRFAGIVQSLKSMMGELSDAGLVASLNPVVEEIATHLNGNTIDRLVEFERMKDDKATNVEKRVALAITGWIFGGGVGIDSMTIAKSSIEARELVKQYIATHDPKTPNVALQPKRIELINKLRSLESGLPDLVHRILTKMLPPLPLPPSIEGMPGRHLVEVPLVDGRGGSMGSTQYLIQLPPEYDPYRIYPCIVSLNGNTDEGTELEWWSGSYNPDWKMPVGLASRAGYIVISPRWRDENQYLDQVTEPEQFRVMASLRDAMRRTSIDSDRVFLAGHQEGGDMAWDLATSQPSIWAGLICISGDGSPYIKHGRANLARLPTYFVMGDLDDVPNPMVRNGAIWQEYASDSSKQDFMLTLYIGRGPDRFQEELPRIMDWLNSPNHRRQDPPENIQAKALRQGNRSFWWLEVVEFRDRLNEPFQEFDFRKVAELDFSRKPLLNSLSFEKMPVNKFRVWLNPQIADMTKKIKISFRGKSKSEDIKPSLDVMLEDARCRSDRQHVYWAYFDMP